MSKSAKDDGDGTGSAAAGRRGGTSPGVDPSPEGACAAKSETTSGEGSEWMRAHLLMGPLFVGGTSREHALLAPEGGEEHREIRKINQLVHVTGGGTHRVRAPGVHFREATRQEIRRERSPSGRLPPARPAGGGSQMECS